MSYLARFEAFMERLVEASLRRMTNKPLDATFLQRRLERAMEANQLVVGVNTLVPHNYTVFLNPRDFGNFGKHVSDTEQRITAYLTQLAQSRGFVTTQPIRVAMMQRNYVPNSDVFIETNEIEGTGADESTADMQVVAADTIRPTLVETTNPEQYGGYVGTVGNARYQLVITSTSGETKQLPITLTHIAIGRAPGNNLILQDGQVSRHHARITFNARRFQITDLASHNGTFVNGERLAAHPYVLDITHDVVTISHYTIRIRPI